MKKRLLLLMLIVFSTLLFGCAADDQQTGVSTARFVGGDQGVETTIRAEPGDGVITRTTPFNLKADVQNFGEYDIKDGDYFVQVQGLIFSFFDLQESDVVLTNLGELRGTSRLPNSNTVIDGEEKTIETKDIVYARDQMHEDPYRVQISGYACYNYKTEAVADVCVKSNLLGALTDADQSGCSFPTRNSPVQLPLENSGAPVQVSAMTQLLSGNKDKVRFTLRLAKPREAAEVLSPDSLDCLENDLKGKAQVKVSADVGQVSCRFSGNTFTDTGIMNVGSQEVECEYLPVAPYQNSQFAVNVELDYKIRENFQTEASPGQLGPLEIQIFEE